MDTDGKFYLGKIYDLKGKEVTEELLLYDPEDLTTHGVVVGMTGSGKTGLCIDLLEEAALQRIPALMIDPKGDITNALLHFPNLAPQDFQPWVNPDDARREGKSIEEAAQDASTLWQNGLAQWGIGKERIEALKESVNFAVYTPGSDSGLPVSILASLEVPDIAWEENRELLREQISSTVTALLGLVGLEDIDPVRSREHILLSNIFEHAWSQGNDLDLGELIMQTQNPPISKLGVFDVDTFFPQKDRFELAMLLNNILASPAFQTWIEGQPLEVSSLLYSPDGKPRHSVFYIAHLNDAERMFFVTLLYSAVESWMRSQSGTTSLRAIVYFDEIFGYLPPIGNPPSKEPMLRMLKQARAFGVGQMLVTQNPVDIDYKALSNAGTWFIGKLQTDQDKQRLLDGLEGVIAGDMNRSELDKLISALGKRVFLVKNVHEKKPQIFYTRWAMNYLTGPLTRTQIPALNKIAGAAGLISEEAETDKKAERTVAETKRPARERPEEELASSLTRPAVPARVDEFFLPNNLTLSKAFKFSGKEVPEEAQSKGFIYRPALLAQAFIRYRNRKYNLDSEVYRAVLVSDPDRRGNVRWDDHLTPGFEEQKMDRKPTPDARFESLEAPLTDSKILASIKSDFLDWAYHSSEVIVKANDKLKVYAGPEVSEEEFRKMCEDAAEELFEADAKKTSASFEKKVQQLMDRIEREQQELEEDEAELSHRKMEEYGTYAETVISLFGGRKRQLSTSLSKRRMTAKAKADVDESRDAIEDFKKDIEELKEERDEALEEIKGKWLDIIEDVEEIPFAPYKKDVILDMFGIAWTPYHLVSVGGGLEALPGYGEGE
jgi:hypothetical protein